MDADLEIHGDPPPEFAAIAADLREKQAEADRKDDNVDYVFDVPPAQAQALTGYRHDYRDPEGMELHALEVALPVVEASPAAAPRRPPPGRMGRPAIVGTRWLFRCAVRHCIFRSTSAFAFRRWRRDDGRIQTGCGSLASAGGSRGRQSHTHPTEDVMRSKLTLDLDQLVVESLPTTPKPQPVEVDDRGDQLTCLQTNCGKILCCA